MADSEGTVWHGNIPGGADISLEQAGPELWKFDIWDRETGAFGTEGSLFVTRKQLLELHRNLGKELGV